MKVNDWLSNTTEQLAQAGIGTARLDALILLEDHTAKNRAWLLAHPEYNLGATNHLDKQIKRRCLHVPLAYIRGKTEFYGREFIINEHVLQPRPETETMIDLLKNVSPESRTIIDIGTGSGAIAITAKLELPKATVIATDIDPKCLKIAKQNAQKHTTGINLLQGDLLQALSTNYQLPTTVLANLPYVPNTYQVNQAAAHEPRHAIFGGEDGLDLYRQLFQQINTMPHRPAYVFTESFPFQHHALADIARQYDFRLAQIEDFIQVLRA